MSEEAVITIRPAVAEDAGGITRVYMESAEHHARLDPDRYWIPAPEEISRRYRENDPPSAQPKKGHVATTLVAEIGGHAVEDIQQTELGVRTGSGEIVGFVEVRLESSPDPMHRDLLYCHIEEIAVSSRTQGQGIGARLLQAAEDWGRQQGAQLASLEFLSTNHRAAALYTRIGYGVVAMRAIKSL